jgi:hypothetical protein
MMRSATQVGLNYRHNNLPWFSSGIAARDCVMMCDPTVILLPARFAIPSGHVRPRGTQDPSRPYDAAAGHLTRESENPWAGSDVTITINSGLQQGTRGSQRPEDDHVSTSPASTLAIVRS